MEILFTSRNPIDHLGDHNRFYLEQELGKIATVHQCGSGWDDPWSDKVESLQHYCDRMGIEPDWVFGSQKIDGAKNFGKVVDMHRIPYKQIRRINRQNFDLVIFNYPSCPVAHVGERNAPLVDVPSRLWFDTIKTNTAILPQSTEPSTFYPKGNNQDSMFDVAFMGDVGEGVYPLRSEFYGKLPDLAIKEGFRLLRHRRMPGKHSKMSMKKILSDNPTIYDNHLYGHVYAKALRLSSTFIFGSSAYGYPLKRYMEAGASNVCIVADAPAMAEELGLVPWKTFIPIDKTNWSEHLMYAIDNPGERRKIARKWHDHVLKCHTSEIRAQEFLSILETYL